MDKIVKGLRRPSLFLVGLRRFVLMGGALSDPECNHLVQAWSSGSLPRLELASIFPGIQDCTELTIRKPESRIVGWSLDLHELVHVLAIVRYTKARRVLEIGTFDGFAALNLAANLDDGGMVYTVDLPPERQVGADSIPNASAPENVGSKFKNEEEGKKIRQLWADSTTADWAQFGSPFDLVLVDGCHDYRYVKSDSENAIKHVRPGGTVIWHDYGQCPDVSRALDELAAEHPIVAVKGTRLVCLRREDEPVRGR